MLIVILFLVVGAFLAYIAQSNLMPVSLSFGPYMIVDIPLFYVILASLGIGFVLSYTIEIFQKISHWSELRTQKNEISRSQETVLELTKRVHQLELENERLKHKPTLEPEDPNAL